MSEEGENRGMDLVTFLLARISEDEEVARFAAATSTGGEWVDSYHNVNRRREGLGPRHAVFEGQPMGLAPAQHVAHWDPARVLAECAAKRRIVAIYTRVDFSESGDVLGGEGPEVYWDALRALALPYSDHSDYDPAWRPEQTA